MGDFILKAFVYLIVLGLPLAITAFLILGCVWLARQLFA